MCSLHWGRLMSRWVSSKLTSVSDRVSPGQAFYHRSSIIRSHSKARKETDSKAASQTKNRASKAEPPAVELMFTTVSLQPCYCCDLNFKCWWNICCWPCYVLPCTATQVFLWGLRIDIAENSNSEMCQTSLLLWGFHFCFKLTQSLRLCFRTFNYIQLKQTFWLKEKQNTWHNRQKYKLILTENRV